VEVSVIDDGERTPLHYATSKGYLDIAKELYQAGADIRARNTSGRTPLNEAESGLHLETILWLRSLDAEVSA
jgi:ankyrin repeat protein